VFTGSAISLSTLVEPDRGVRLVRDCMLCHVAKIPSKVSRRVVPCNRASQLQNAAQESEVVGVIVPPDLEDQVPTDLGLLLAINPLKEALFLHEKLCNTPNFHWQDFPSEIDLSAKIDASACVAEKNVKIGKNTIVHPGAVVLPRSIIGCDCSIGPSTVVGTDAFEVNSFQSPRTIVTQAGGVQIEDNVDIQAKCTIVRATFGGFTRIRRESKLDCQIHVAHDCDIGERVRIAACAELSGRVNIGNDAFVGPNASISNGITVGPKAHITIGAVVIRDVQEGERVSGNFAMDHMALIRHIKEISSNRTNK